MKELIGLFCILFFMFRILVLMIKVLYYVVRIFVLLLVIGYKCYKECKVNKRESNFLNILFILLRENNR